MIIITDMIGPKHKLILATGPIPQILLVIENEQVDFEITRISRIGT